MLSIFSKTDTILNLFLSLPQMSHYFVTSHLFSRIYLALFYLIHPYVFIYFYMSVYIVLLHLLLKRNFLYSTQTSELAIPDEDCL